MSDDAKPKLMPVLLVKPGTMKRSEIARAQKFGGFCIIECADPEAVRLLDAPLSINLDEHARAGMALLRFVTERNTDTTYTGGGLMRVFINALMSQNKPPVVPPATKAAK